jgi:hypothetical protein
MANALQDWEERLEFYLAMVIASWQNFWKSVAQDSDASGVNDLNINSC